MQPVCAAFEMTDALFGRAVREQCVASARKHVRVRDLLIVAASAAIFCLAVARDSHWLWWIAGVAPAVFALLSVGWLAAYWWLPRAALRRLAHLPHRRVTIELGDSGLAFQTATERLEVAWEELKALTRLPGFWLISLRSGARIPVPIEVLPPEAVATLESKAGKSGSQPADPGSAATG